MRYSLSSTSLSELARRTCTSGVFPDMGMSPLLGRGEPFSFQMQEAVESGLRCKSEFERVPKTRATESGNPLADRERITREVAGRGLLPSSSIKGMFEGSSALVNLKSSSSRGGWWSRTRIDVTSEIEDLLSRVQSAVVTVPDPAKVADYLLAHLDMGGVLLSACGAACKSFGPDMQLSLEVYRDPEIDDEYLTLYVRPKKYDSTLLDRIDTVRAEYQGNLADKSGWFLVTTDFQPPR